MAVTKAKYGDTSDGGSEKSDIQIRGLSQDVRDRLREAIEVYGSVSAVAKLLGISASALGENLSGGREPRASLVAAIAQLTGRSLDWIMFGSEMGAPLAQTQTMRPMQLVPALPPAGTEMVMVPFYDVRASAGAGSLAVNERPTSEMGIARQMLRQLDISPSDAALMGVQGDSAEPTLSEGDLILINRALRDLRDGCMYVIGIDEDVIVKRVERLMDGSVLLKSDNPAYRPQTVPAAELNRLRVIGRVRWALHQI